MKLSIATCQFPVSGDIRRNGRRIRDAIRFASRERAHVVQFPEVGLSGYASVHFDTHDDFDWDTLTQETEAIQRLARKHGIWVILGSAHRLGKDHAPHNCLYAINAKGEIADRYDKLFCTGNDLRNYTPGTHFSVFDIRGMRCGMLICHDVRYPELYRAYKKKGVCCMFHSW